MKINTNYSQREYSSPDCAVLMIENSQCLCASYEGGDAFGSTLEGWDVETI